MSTQDDVSHISQFLYVYYLQDLKKFCDEATDGIIYFSLGTILKSSELSPKKLEIFSKVFGGLKQRVLWKWESDNPPKVSDNVLVSKWLPQSAILSECPFKNSYARLNPPLRSNYVQTFRSFIT